MVPKTMANNQQLKDVLKGFSDAELLVSELTGGFSFMEVIQMGKVAQDLPVILQDASVLWPEFTGLDAAAQADLVAYVQANCKFPASLTAEQWVDKALTAAIYVSSLFSFPKKA